METLKETHGSPPRPRVRHNSAESQSEPSCESDPSAGFWSNAWSKSRWFHRPNRKTYSIDGWYIEHYWTLPFYDNNKIQQVQLSKVQVPTIWRRCWEQLVPTASSPVAARVRCSSPLGRCQNAGLPPRCSDLQSNWDWFFQWFFWTFLEQKLDKGPEAWQQKPENWARPSE